MKSKLTLTGRLSAALLGLLLLPLGAFASLSGNYTIDGSASASSTNYKTFSAAVGDMLSGTRSDGGSANGSGVSGAVTFTVSDGSYNEQIYITGITGASSTNTITFVGKSGDSSKVVLYYAPTGSGTPSKYDVLWLSGAKWLRFKDMTIRNTSTGNTTVVRLNNAASNNQFLNCHLKGVYQASTSSIGFTAGDGSCVYSFGADTNNLFQNNRLTYGYNGFFFSNTSSSMTGIRLINNIIDSSGCSAVYANNCDGLVMSGNTVTIGPFPSSSGHYVSYGLRMENANSPRILKNKFYCLSDAQVSRGIVIFGNSGSTSAPGIMANNWMILSGGSTSSTGIAISSDQYMHVAYNSVLMTSSLSTGAAFYTYSGYTGSNQEVFNNNFIHKGGGYAVDIQNTGITDMDYNNLYVTGTYIGRYVSGTSTNTYTKLSDWKSGWGMDANSISLDPGYVSASDLHVTAAGLDGKGTPYTFVTDDIDGQSRHSSTPDIGSDEFTPPQRDAGVSKLDSPYLFCAGTQGIYVKFGNYGVNTLTSLDINWSVNGTAQTSYSWTGSLASGNTSSSIKLGTYSFSSNTKYVFKIWTSSPNGSTDQDNRNDTLATDVYTGLSGSFTVGGTSPDFKSLNEAASALYSRGVCGATTFKIRAGTYPEQLTLNPIPGTSASNTVTFISEDNNYTKVTLELSSTTATGVNNAAIQLNGADYVTFSDMTIKRTGSNTYAMVIEIKNGSHHNRFLDNMIVGIKTGTATANTNSNVFTSLADKDTGNWIKNNIITYGYRSIDLYSASGTPENGWVIEGNTIDQSYNTAILVQNNDGIVVSKNKLYNIGTAGGAYAISLSACHGAIQINENSVNMTHGGPAAVSLADCQAGSSARGSVVNNMISMQATGTYASPVALSLGTIANLDIYFNTLHVYGTNTSGAALKSINSGSANSNFKNNVYANSGGGPAFYLGYSNIVNTSDYNNYDASGSTLAVWDGTSYTSLSGMQSASSKDANSVATKTFFGSNAELHTITPGIDAKGTAISGITTDIDGDTRGTPPDIGADEFDIPKNNAGIPSLASAATVCVGSSSIQVRIRNYGTDTLLKATVNWIVDGVTMTPVSWTGKLATDSSAVVTLGSYTLTTDISLKSWTTSPNGATDGFKYDDTLNITIKAVQLPAANAGQSQHLCIGNGVAIGAPAVSGSTYSWSSVPAGFTSTDPNPTVAPTVTTTYTLTETNSTGCKKTNKITITLNQLPAPNIVVSGSNPNIKGPDTVQACDGYPIILTTKSVSGSSYFWSGPPGFNESTQSVKLTPVIVNGEEYITYYLRETVDSSSCYQEDTVVVHINSLPFARAGTDRSVCEGSQITIGSAGTPGNTYSWRSVPSGFISTADKPVVTPSVTTTYILTETTPDGCAKSDSVIITVKPAPKADVGAPQTICEGGSTGIGAAPLTGHTYNWTSIPSGFSSNKANPTVSPAVTTTYYLVVQNTSTGCSKKDSVVVTVNPTPDVEVTGPVTTCQGPEYVYKSSSIGNNSYQWSVKGGTLTNFSAPDSISVRWTSALGEVWLRLESDVGCSDTFILNVTAQPTPKPGFTAGAVCLGDITVFNNTSTGGTSYEWSFGDGNASVKNSPGHTYAEPGTYRAILLARNAAGCMDTVSQIVTVHPLPDAGWSAMQLSASTYSFTAHDTTSKTYLWDFGDGNIDNKPAVTHTYAAKGSYKVTLKVTDDNGCESADDSTLSVTVGIGETDFLATNLKVFPNPFESSLTLEYELAKAAYVSISLTDVTGRVVAELPSAMQFAGKQKYEMPVSTSLMPGVYILRLSAGGTSATRMLMKME